MWNQLWLITWKNLRIRKRHWFLTLLEILTPIILFTMLAFGRSKISTLKKIEIKTATYYPLKTEQQLVSLPENSKLWYTPHDSFNEEIILKSRFRFDLKNKDIEAFTSENELIQHYREAVSAKDMTIFAVIFHGNDTKSLNYDLSIYEKYLMWNTDKMFDTDEDEIGSWKYLEKGFIAMQMALNKAFIEISLGIEDLNATFSLQPFPYPPHIEDNGLDNMFKYFLPLFTVFSLISLYTIMVESVMEEKYSGNREYMKMFGMKNWTLILGWYINILCTNVLTLIVLVGLMKFPIWNEDYPPIKYCSGSVLFLFLLFYCTAVVMSCFLICDFFSKPWYAGVTAVVLSLMSHFIPKTILNSNESMSKIVKYLFGMFPNVALQYGYSAILPFEKREITLGWNNLKRPGSENWNDVTMFDVFILFLVQINIFTLLTIYMSNINPGKFGTAKPFHFFLKFLYNKKKLSGNDNSLNEIDEGPEHTSLIELRIKESPTESTVQRSKSMGKLKIKNPICISIKNLTKKYGTTPVLKDLSMDIYRNEITVVLGENGAGKSTLLSIIAGMISPTSGTITFFDEDGTERSADDIGRKLGVCTQEPILFSSLTVKENLIFFSVLRGKSFAEADEESDKICKDLELSSHKGHFPDSLSGEAKRKLAIGLAYSGNPEILVLDEPTAETGSKTSRKILSDLLKRGKDKTIIICTQYLEEASVLSDKPWVVKEQKIEQLNEQEPKYLLTMALQKSSEETTNKIKETVTEILSVDTDKLESFADANKLFIRLPNEQKENFTTLLHKLEKNRQEYNIARMSIATSSFRDKHSRLQGEESNKRSKITFDQTKIELEELRKLEQRPTKRLTINALFLKRWYFLKKSYYWNIIAVVSALVPIFIAIGLGLGGTEYYTYSGSALELRLSKFGPTEVYFSSMNNENERITNYYKNIAEVQNGKPDQAQNVSETVLTRGVGNIISFKRSVIVGAEFKIDHFNQIEVNCLYSRAALHSAPISLNLAMNSVAKAFLGDDYSIITSNKPFKPVHTHISRPQVSETEILTLWSLLLPLGFFSMISIFIIFPKSETSSKFFHMQLKAGVNSIIYWLCNLISDLGLFIINSLFVILALIPVNLFYNAFGASELCAIFVIWCVCALANLPFIYLFSLSKFELTRFTYILTSGILLGIVPGLVVSAMESSGDEYYENAVAGFKSFLIVTNPLFALCYLCFKFTRKFVENYNWTNMDGLKKQHICSTPIKNPCCGASDDTLQCWNHKSYFFNEELGIQLDILLTLLPCAIYFLALIVVRTRRFRRVKKDISNLWHITIHSMISTIRNKKEPKNGIISISEYKKLKEKTKSPANQKGFNALDITEIRGGRKKVNKVTIRIKEGECYCLQGTGRTEVFRLLSGDALLCHGDVTIQDSSDTISIQENYLKYCKGVGLCPQKDCLNSSLTAKELITIMAMIKGYQEPHKVVKALLNVGDLNDGDDKPCGKCSAGIRRRLNLTLAFVGLPQVLLLDEPTVAMDPIIRSHFWRILSYLKIEKEISIFLSTLRDEECDVLNDEIGILDQGELDQSTLDTEPGFVIKLQVKKINSDVESIIKTSFSEGKFSDDGSGWYSLDFKNGILSKLFETTENFKNKNDFIKEYAIVPRNSNYLRIP